ncbi:uncharacterized protein Z519_05328 [Cladophialophora bantiana CBS 173.52]|uniref:SMP domain-containing protein n=1 Tax=Cladophialophora bantiana (strain ATCC 10958 / CBS 173.52 / CDC B-1940 / NIH 8579) TaxID=1442370 RepID=A0A0D2G612_CLAB1|nr:uncharacterized protein Z519_05328 [Cladophialophora bantiana CBS 173.52]KIW94012.1 hypothetical protein Z519_05328 [Cladophialophora bantiana CBS 173.52]
MTTDPNITTDPTFATTRNANTTTDPSKTDTSTTATYTSSDPSTAPHAPSTHKILGDIKGAVHGVTGSIQAATGTMFGQEKLAEKGFDKMTDEDVRLAAKTGKPPVGTEQRSSVVESTDTSGSAAEHGRGLRHERT